VPVELPVSTATPQPQQPDPLVLSVKADLSLSIGDTPVNKEALPAALDAASKGDKRQRIFLRADRIVAYGDLMEVMNVLRAAGYLEIALVGLEAPVAGS
jgi:biopolymer transport protein ExbD